MADLNLHVSDFHLGDVVLYVNTATDVYTVDPFTGRFETDVTDTGQNCLPDTLSNPWLTYGDIAMRNDGMLYTLTLRGNAPGLNQNNTAGQYRRLDTGDAKNLLHNQNDGIITYQLDPLTSAIVTQNNSGVEFQAIAHEPNIQRRNVYAVGNRLPGLGVPITTNLLYVLDANGQAIQYPNYQVTPRLPTNYVPLARLLTAPTIVPVNATDTEWPYNDPGDVLDGTKFDVYDGNTTLTFELDCGPDIRLDPTGANAVRDEETFTLGDGTTNVTFEFNSGPVIVTGDASQLVDGETFTLQDSIGVLATFEFSDVNDPTPIVTGNVEIRYAPLQNTQAVIQLIVDAINGASTNGFNVAAAGFTPDGLEGRITLVGDTMINLGTTIGIATQGNYGLANASHVEIPFEETDPVDLLGMTIVTEVENALPMPANRQSGVDAGYAHRIGEPVPLQWGDRLTFFGANVFDFSNVSSFTLWPDITGTLSGPGIAPTSHVVVPFAADYTFDDLAFEIALAVNNGFRVDPTFVATARVNGNSVDFFDALSVTGDPPLFIDGEGPGGLITGMAFLGDRPIAVSDRGGFYEVMRYDSYSLHPTPMQRISCPISTMSSTATTAPISDTSLPRLLSSTGIGFSRTGAGTAECRRRRSTAISCSQPITKTTSMPSIPMGILQPVFVDGQSTSIRFPWGASRASIFRRSTTISGT